MTEAILFLYVLLVTQRFMHSEEIVGTTTKGGRSPGGVQISGEQAAG